MTTTYDRPVKATMIVRLETGEEFEATEEDFGKFGCVDRETVLADWQSFIKDATGTDPLSEDSDFHPLWVALFYALKDPGMLTSGSLSSTQVDIIALAGDVRSYRAEAKVV